MSTTTPNLGLVKPSLSDVADITTMNANWDKLDEELKKQADHTHTADNVGAVPTSRTVNGKALSSDITLSASDVGARPSTWTPTASDISSGTLGVARGGTGATTHTSNAVLTGNGTGAVKNVATASGALYATSVNGAAKFGTLPVAQGGTGMTSAIRTSTSNSYFITYLAKFGNLVVCSLMRKTSHDTVLNETSISLLSSYYPKEQVTYHPYSATCVTGGGGIQDVDVAVNTDGTLTISCPYGYKASDVEGTYCWLA